MQLSKRAFFQTSSLALIPVALAASARAQTRDAPLSAITANEVATGHSELVATARTETPDHDPWAADALKRVTGILRELGIITEAEQQFLNALIDAVMNADSLDGLPSTIRQLIDDAANELTELGRIIGAIVQSSVDAADALLSGIEWGEVRDVILTDLRGALDGARAGFRWFGVPGAIAGAAIGGTAASMPAFASA
jgi:hypothetical protein